MLLVSKLSLGLARTAWRIEKRRVLSVLSSLAWRPRGLGECSRSQNSSPSYPRPLSHRRRTPLISESR
eukprot:2981250-Prymnesium_polylepis.1